MVSPTRRREAVDLLREWHPGLSIRRACGLVGLSRNAVKAPRAKIDKDKPLVAALTKLAAKHPRLGYRMLHHPVVTWSSERASGSAGIRSTDCAAAMGFACPAASGGVEPSERRRTRCTCCVQRPGTTSGPGTS